VGSCSSPERTRRPPLTGSPDDGLTTAEREELNRLRRENRQLRLEHQMVDLVRAGRSPEELAREFEPTAQSIRNWLAQSERNAGRGGGTQAGRLLLSCPSWTPPTQIVRCPRNRSNFRTGSKGRKNRH
jgi:transposase-like protein